jgi:hypothetical protein
MAILRNTFTGGMMQDPLASFQPNSSYRMALNAVQQTETATGFGLANELSNELSHDFGGDIVGTSYIEEWHKTLVFLYKGGRSELHLFDHATYEATFVASDQEFGCDWQFSDCEFLYGEFKHFNSCEDLYVYFSAGCNYYVVNISEMLAPVRKDAVKRSEQCDYFDLFRCICGPSLSVTPIRFSGGAMEGGAVSFAVQLEDEDGNTTNWFNISQVVYLGTENNIPGEPTDNAARLNMDYLDPRYSKVNIAVIKTVGGVTTVEKMRGMSYSSNGISYDYYGQRGEPINLAEITTKAKSFLRGRDLIQKDGRLFFYNLKNEKNLNYQKWANQIVTKLVKYEVTMEQNQRYNYPSLLRGEVYAPAIVWNYCDGTHSYAFHIPMSAPTIGGDATQGRQARAEDAGANPNGQMGANNYNTTDQHRRRRNPSNQGNEPDTVEEANRADIEAVDSNEQTLKDAAACHDNLYGCDTAGTAFNQDLDQYSNIAQTQAEMISEMTSGDKEPEDVVVGKTGSLKEAAEELMSEGVKNREYETYKKPTFTHSATQTVPTEATSDSNDVVEPGRGTTKRGDNWVDGDGNNLTEEPPRKIWTGLPNMYQSSLEYPRELDCDGERFYPEGNIRFPKIPDTSIHPHFVSYTDGVINERQPENFEYGNTYVHLLGFSFENIHIPSEDELPKPLCPTNPYTIVYVKRTAQNKSVFAKGYFTGTFEGDVYGKTYAFPRHGVNSFEHVDRHIHAGEDGTSRMGRQTPNATSYNFHSPDTDCDQSFLPITHVRPELALYGSGWRYGLYEEGRRVIQDQWSGTRIDQRGARVANNLNHYRGTGTGDISVEGLTYAQGNTSVTNPAGIFYPLMNKYRESSVYLQAASRLLGDTLDKSFVGDVLDHDAPTSCNAPYGALVRKLPDQYGSIDSLSYIPLGLTARPQHLNANPSAIEGICGDIFIVPYSKRRTSYVSNKIGDTYEIPAKPGSSQRTRSVCDSPDDKVFELMGINHYPTRLPQSGDIYDPRNYAGLHTVPGVAGPPGETPPENCACASCPQSTSVGVSSYSIFPNTLTFYFGAAGSVSVAHRGTLYTGEGIVGVDVEFGQTEFGFDVTVVDGPCTYTATYTLSPSLGGSQQTAELDCECADGGGTGGGGTPGTPGTPSYSRPAAEASNIGFSESDFYYPRVLKSLVHCVVESSVNTTFLQTGLGSQIGEGKVYYPKLKDLELDSRAPSRVPWEEAFLNRFYSEVQQPSLKQLAKKALIRTGLNLIVPMLGLLRFDALESIVDTAGAMVTLPMLTAMWVYANNTLFTDKKLNELLGIGGCKTDSEGGDLDATIRNWEDAYCKYNWDYSKTPDEQAFYAPPLNYNTCDCDDCYKGDRYGFGRQLNNEIYHSNKQNMASEIDAYRNVRINSYNELPTHAGYLQKLFNLGGVMYAHTSEGIWIIKMGEGKFPSDIGGQLTGTGEMLAEPQLMLEGSYEGFLGTIHPNAAINVGGWGYFFIDEIAGKVYRFNGEPEEISAYGMSQFFRNHLAICEDGDCIDEGTSVHYALGWDPTTEQVTAHEARR